MGIMNFTRICQPTISPVIYAKDKILASSSITRIVNTWRQVVFSDDNVYTVLIFLFIFVKGIICVRMKLAFLRSLLFLTPKCEMKKHNALEHTGHISRSKRNVIQQIPTGFTYPRSNEQDNRRGT